RLPGLSGIDLIRRAPELSEGGPVIMVADTGHSAQIVEAIQAGADDFIRRPYTADDLENAIRTVAGRPRREAAAAAPTDDHGELHPALQAKLLHVLQDGEFSRVGGRNNLRVDVRTICATNRDLAREVAAGRFREDLFYRLNVINVLVPPLRERCEEIPGLVAY